MKILSEFALFLCLLFFSSINAQNTSNVLPVLHLPQQMKDSIHLRPYTSFYFDSDMKTPTQDVKNQVFKPLDSLKYLVRTKETWYYLWLRFSVENTSADTIKMSLNMTRFDSISIHTLQNGVLTKNLVIGRFIRQHPQPEKKMYPSNTTALLYFPPHSIQTFYVRCQQMDFEPDPHIQLFRPESEAQFFLWELIIYYAWYMCFMGILCFVFITALVNYGQTRHKAFLFYAGYIWAQFAFYWRDFENYDQFSYTLPTWLLDYAYRTPISWAWGIFYLLFLIHFFDTKRRLPQMHLFIKISLGFYIGILLIDRVLVFYDYWLAQDFVVISRYFLRFSGLLLLIYMIIKLKNNRLSHYILVGTLCYTVGAILTGFATSSSLFWDDGLLYHQLGILAELVCFSMGLAYKFRLDTIEKERLTVTNQQLSLENTLTTLEKERLSLEIALKETQIRTEVALDIHDKVGAELSKMSLTAQNDSNLPDVPNAFLKERIRYYGNEARLLSDKMREIIFAIDPEYSNFEDMQAYFREYARNFWANLNVEVIYDFESNTEGDRVVISTNLKRHLLPIFTEAQNNAAKYAQTKKVYLTFKLINPNQYLLEIKDEGIGFDIHKINHVHSKTKGISGIKHRAETIHAAYSIDSVMGQGTTISILGAVKSENNDKK